MMRKTRMATTSKKTTTMRTALADSSIHSRSRAQRVVVVEVVEACVIVSIRRIQTHLEPKVRKVSDIKTAIVAEVEEVIVVDVAAIEGVAAEAATTTMEVGTEVKLLGTVATMEDIVVKVDTIAVKVDTKGVVAAVAEATATTTTKANAAAIAATTPAVVTITTTISVVDVGAADTPDRRATLSPMPREKSSTRRSSNNNSSSSNSSRLELIDS